VERVVIMHSYASDSLDRRFAPWIIAVGAISIAYLYFALSTKYQFSLPWWCETPSIMLVYGGFHWIYDSRLWKGRFLGLALSQIPNCNGTWHGELRSSYDGKTEIEGILLVHQTWTKIALEFRTGSSASYSRMASLNVTPGASQGLIYEYTNDPRAGAKETMHAHRGFSFLKVSADGNWLEGDYYTGRDRTNFGTIRLRLVSRQRLDLSEAKTQRLVLEKGAA
jgi:SMODS-associating 2TM, beta-strand rich effector domain